jgi:hypothetical protein
VDKPGKSVMSLMSIVGRMEDNMKNLFFKLFPIVILITSAFLGCSANPRPDTSTEDCNVRVGLQLQKSSSLSAGRYTMLLDAIRKGNVDDAKNDIDYWLDLAIIELQFLEESYPNTQWAETPLKGLEEVKMRKIYGDIARYRLDHPRKHTVPLDDNLKRLIDTFIERYK